MTPNDQLRREIRGKIAEVFTDAYRRGPAFVTGKPALSETELRAAGVPARFHNQARDLFAEVGIEAGVSTVARKLADALMDDIATGGQVEPENPGLLQAMLGR